MLCILIVKEGKQTPVWRYWIKLHALLALFAFVDEEIDGSAFWSAVMTLCLYLFKETRKIIMLGQDQLIHQEGAQTRGSFNSSYDNTQCWHD